MRGRAEKRGEGKKKEGEGKKKGGEREKKGRRKGEEIDCTGKDREYFQRCLGRFSTMSCLENLP